MSRLTANRIDPSRVVAAQSGDRSAFAELFANTFGRPPINFVHHIRLQRAAEMLSASPLSIDEIADQVGFSSRSQFARAFKRHMGSPPHTFRENTREHKAPLS